MKINRLHIDGVFEIEPNVHEDERGWFHRVFCKDTFSQFEIPAEWVQINHSFTQQKGSIRGMHFQLPPHGEIKMVKCISGKIHDVVGDIRKESPTFLQSVSVELSAQNRKMLYIPKGFAHGFQTLTDDVEIIYFHSTNYTPGAESGLLHNDPLLNIHWPLKLSNISTRDLQHEALTKTFTGI